jgi:hypothetical protein
MGSREAFSRAIAPKLVPLDIEVGLGLLDLALAEGADAEEMQQWLQVTWTRLGGLLPMASYDNRILDMDRLLAVMASQGFCSGADPDWLFDELHWLVLFGLTRTLAVLEAQGVRVVTAVLSGAGYGDCRWGYTATRDKVVQQPDAVQHLRQLIRLGYSLADVSLRLYARNVLKKGQTSAAVLLAEHGQFSPGADQLVRMWPWMCSTNPADNEHTLTLLAAHGWLPFLRTLKPPWPPALALENGWTPQRGSLGDRRWTPRRHWLQPLRLRTDVRVIVQLTERQPETGEPLHPDCALTRLPPELCVELYGWMAVAETRGLEAEIAQRNSQ